jgi:hypothetical protein
MSEAEYSHVTYDVTTHFARSQHPGQQKIEPYYKAMGWFYPLLRVLFPDKVSPMPEVGLPMINSVAEGLPKQVVEIKNIKSLAKA